MGNNGWCKDDFSRHALNFLRTLDALKSVATKNNSNTDRISLPKLSPTAIELLEELFGEMCHYFGLTAIAEPRKYLMFGSFYETFSQIILTLNQSNTDNGIANSTAHINTNCSCTHRCYNNWYEEVEVIWQLMAENLRYYAEEDQRYL